MFTDSLRVNAPVRLPPQLWGWDESQPSVRTHCGPGSPVLLCRPGDREQTWPAISPRLLTSQGTKGFIPTTSLVTQFHKWYHKVPHWLWNQIAWNFRIHLNLQATAVTVLVFPTLVFGVVTVPVKRCQSLCWGPSAGVQGWWCCWSRRAAEPGCLPGSHPVLSPSASP